MLILVLPYLGNTAITDANSCTEMENMVQLAHTTWETYTNGPRTSILPFPGILTLFRASMQLLTTLNVNIQCPHFTSAGPRQFWLAESWNRVSTTTNAFWGVNCVRQQLYLFSDDLRLTIALLRHLFNTVLQYKECIEKGVTQAINFWVYFATTGLLEASCSSSSLLDFSSSFFFSSSDHSSLEQSNLLESASSSSFLSSASATAVASASSRSCASPVSSAVSMFSWSSAAANSACRPISFACENDG